MGTNHYVYTATDLDAIADKLSGRTRKILGYSTAVEDFDRLLE